jgi:hypothetical protein
LDTQFKQSKTTERLENGKLNVLNRQNSFFYSSYVEFGSLSQLTTHKGAHNHDITMTKCGKFVEPNPAGAIGVLGIAGIVL